MSCEEVVLSEPKIDRAAGEWDNDASGLQSRLN